METNKSVSGKQMETNNGKGKMEEKGVAKKTERGF